MYIFYVFQWPYIHIRYMNIVSATNFWLMPRMKAKSVNWVGPMVLPFACDLCDLDIFSRSEKWIELRIISPGHIYRYWKYANMNYLWKPRNYYTNSASAIDSSSFYTYPEPCEEKSNAKGFSPLNQQSLQKADTFHRWPADFIQRGLFLTFYF